MYPWIKWNNLVFSGVFYSRAPQSFIDTCRTNKCFYFHFWTGKIEAKQKKIIFMSHRQSYKEFNVSYNSITRLGFTLPWALRAKRSSWCNGIFSYKAKLTIFLTCPEKTGPVFIHAYASGEVKHQQVRTVTWWMQKNPYGLLKKPMYIPTWQHRVWEKETPSFSPYTVGIPDCADAMFGSRLCYTSGWKQTCSPPWPAAIQNGDWSAQKLWTWERKKERTRVRWKYSSIKQIISHESQLQKPIHSLGAQCQKMLFSHVPVTS